MDTNSAIDPRAKIRPLADIAAEIARLRAAGKRVAHCHGCFDLLHIGHLRYLQGARALADALVVTVTPDVWVNKGPNRPAFGEAIRLEAVAALGCVDYVGLNEWPTAVETIELLKPSFYCKGAEYKDRRTPEIIAEEAVAGEVGCEMAYIDDLRSSSSHLINRHLSPYDDEVTEYLVRLSERHDAADVLEFVRHAADLDVLVVGETLIDEYHYCHALGRSVRAPLVTMRHLAEERFIGGAAALANHLADFCGQVTLVSQVGDEDNEEQWLRGQLHPAVAASFVRKPGAPTILNRRYRESYYGQFLFEVCFLNDEPLLGGAAQQLTAELRRQCPRHDLVIVVDYGHGMMGSEAIGQVCEQSRFLALNVQVNGANLGFQTLSAYPRADYVCLAEMEVRLECRSREGDLRAMLPILARQLGAQRAVATRGKHGCLAHCVEAGFCEAPSVALQVLDRVGASEAFLAVSALCAVQQAPLEVLAFLGNVAGAEQVGQIGGQKSLTKLPLSRHVETLLR